MSFRINTNVAALNAHTIGVRNNRDLASSLEKLSWATHQQSSRRRFRDGDCR
ncbi:hypothetical protein ASB1_00750 [Helicobacter heilmannii]|nr:hypothetical protein ASB1_00750 [Helicobacter heilmannii]